MVQYFFKFDLIQKAGTGHMQCCEITCYMHMFDQKTNEMRTNWMNQSKKHNWRVFNLVFMLMRLDDVI